MKSFAKFNVSLLILVSMFLIMVLPCSAVAETPITPLWDNISEMRVNLNFQNQTGFAEGWLKKRPGVETLSGTVTVYKYENNNWLYVTSKTANSTRYLNINLNFDAESGVQYKVIFVGTAYRNGVGESHTESQIKTCP